MGQILIGGIQRIVNDYGRPIIVNASIHIDIPVKISGIGSDFTSRTSGEDVDPVTRLCVEVYQRTAGKHSARPAKDAATAAESRNSGASGGCPGRQIGVPSETKDA